MLWVMVALIGLLVWVVATVLIDAYVRRPDNGLAGRLWPYRSTSVADDAEEWLKNMSR